MQGEQYLSVKYDDIFGSLTEQKETVKVLARYWRYETNYSTIAYRWTKTLTKLYSYTVNVVFVK